MRARERTAGAWVFFPLSLALLTCGCQRGARQELIEAELRTREIQLNSLRDEMCRLEGSNLALQREVMALRGGGFGSHFPPEEAGQTLTLRSIALARGTGGLDDDGRPGDEALQVVVEPRDTDGHAIKAPGSLLVQALAVTPEGLKQPVSAWEIPPEQLRRSWKSGLLTTGYSLTLPWKSLPTSDRVRVVARLVLTDGRAFEAEKDITVRLVPGAGFATMPREGEAPKPVLAPLPPPGAVVVPAPAPIMGPAVPLPPGFPVERLLAPPGSPGPVLPPPTPLPSPAGPPLPALPAPPAPAPTWPAPAPKPIDPPLKGVEPPPGPDMARRGGTSASGLARTAAKEPPATAGSPGARDGLSRAVHLERPVPVPQRVEWGR